MVELYGLRTDHVQYLVGGSFETQEIRDLVATFDTKHWYRWLDYLYR